MSTRNNNKNRNNTNNNFNNNNNISNKKNNAKTTDNTNKPVKYLSGSTMIAIGAIVIIILIAVYLFKEFKKISNPSFKLLNNFLFNVFLSKLLFELT